MKCTNCLKELPENLSSSVEFCPFCGKKMEPSKCPGCGEPIVKGAAFCYKCGTALNTSDVPKDPFSEQALKQWDKEWEDFFKSDKSETNTKPAQPTESFGFPNSVPKAQSDEKHFNKFHVVDKYLKLFEKAHGIIKDNNAKGKFRITRTNQEIQNVVEDWGYGGTRQYSKMSRQEILDGCSGYYSTEEFGDVNCVAVCPFTYKTFYAKKNQVFSAETIIPIISANGNVCSLFYCDGILAVTTLIDIQDKGYKQEEWMQGDYGEYYYKYAAKLETAFYEITGDRALLLCSCKDVSAIRNGFFSEKYPHIIQMIDYDCNEYILDTKQNELTTIVSSEKFANTFPFAKHHFGFQSHKGSVAWYSMNGENTTLIVWDGVNSKTVKLLPDDEPQERWKDSLFGHPFDDSITCKK